jgi:hypothetical protein
VATGDQSTRYRHYASECLRLAQLAPSSQKKDLLLQMAETWRRLAEQAESAKKPDPRLNWSRLSEMSPKDTHDNTQQNKSDKTPKYPSPRLMTAAVDRRFF